MEGVMWSAETCVGCVSLWREAASRGRQVAAGAFVCRVNRKFRSFFGFGVEQTLKTICKWLPHQPRIADLELAPGVGGALYPPIRRPLGLVIILC